MVKMYLLTFAIYICVPICVLMCSAFSVQWMQHSLLGVMAYLRPESLLPFAPQACPRASHLHHSSRLQANDCTLLARSCIWLIEMVTHGGLVCIMQTQGKKAGKTTLGLCHIDHT